MTRLIARLLLAAAALALSARGAFAAEEKSLLAPDGTLYVVRAGSAQELGLTGSSIRPDDNAIQWTLRRQDGARSNGLVPDSAGASAKRNLDLAFDEPSGSLLLLWKEETPVLEVLHLGIFKSGAWTHSDLMPNLGLSHVYNPQMLLLHQTARYQDSSGRDRTKLCSIASLIWWEDSYVGQARYAPIFLDEDVSPSDVRIFDLPVAIGGGGPTSYDKILPGAYLYPSLQLEGPGGALLASFADLNAIAPKHYVVRISFPSDWGKADGTNATWLRRRIPVFGVASEAPVAPEVQAPVGAPVRTVIGPSYNPTLVWRADESVRYTRFDGKKWSSAKSIPLTDEMPYEKAMRLVEEMATKN